MSCHITYIPQNHSYYLSRHLILNPRQTILELIFDNMILIIVLILTIIPTFIIGRTLNIIPMKLHSSIKPSMALEVLGNNLGLLRIVLKELQK